MDKREKVISILKKNGLESYIPLFEKNNLSELELTILATEKGLSKFLSQKAA